MSGHPKRGMLARRATLEADLLALEGLDHPSLKARFHALYGKIPPKRIGKGLLILAIAFEMQKKAHGVSADRLMARLARYDAAKAAARKTQTRRNALGDSRNGSSDPERMTGALTGAVELQREAAGSLTPVWTHGDAPDPARHINEPDNVASAAADADPAVDAATGGAPSQAGSERRRRRRGLPKINRTIRPGGRLVREWQGKTYEVFVAEDACYVDGRKYASLSAAATAITGVKRNGPAFFGLRSPRVMRA